MKRNNNGKRQVEIRVMRTFAMLKYGRNEKLLFCVFIGHEPQKQFRGIIIFSRRVLP